MTAQTASVATQSTASASAVYAASVPIISDSAPPVSYQGKSNKEIAEELFLSESTVKTHIYNIFRKMDVKNRIEVICIINEEQIMNEE